MQVYKDNISGFTLVELIITLVIAAILAALAAPSFVGTIRDSRTATNANMLLSSLNLAKSEAIKRGQVVSIRHYGAIANVWDDGWFIFVDQNADGVFDEDGDASACEDGEDCVIKIVEALSNGYTLRSNSNFSNSISFLPDGVVKTGGASGTGNGTFTLCDDTAQVASSRSITINKLGRARVETAKAGSQCS